jgi:hypothetical protein
MVLRQNSSKARHLALAVPLILVLAALGTAFWMITIASRRTLTTLELTLFQVIALGLGIGASYAFGRQSAQMSARELVKPHARGAFRRLVSMYEALQKVGIVIQERRELFAVAMNLENGTIPKVQADAALDVLEALVVGQIGTANDAMEDWRDIVPDEVQEIERRLQGEALA